MLWHERSWPEIDALDRQTPVVLPLGSCEQHGRHLPLLVDTIQVQAVADGVHQTLGDKVLVAPTLWLGCSHHHMDFPGTISVLPSLYTSMVKSMVCSVLNAGFRRIFLLNGHGGNEIPGTQALTELVGENDLADAAWLTFGSWWRVGKAAINPEKHGLTTGYISHACEYETSLMLAIRPDLVKLANAIDLPDGFRSHWIEGTQGNTVQIFRRFHRLTGSGSLGKPSAATAAKGESMLKAIVDDVSRFVTDLASWPELPGLKK